MSWTTKREVIARNYKLDLHANVSAHNCNRLNLEHTMRSRNEQAFSAFKDHGFMGVWIGTAATACTNMQTGESLMLVFNKS